MKLLGVLVGMQNPTDKQVYIPVREYEMSSVSVFSRGTAKDTFKFLVRESLLGVQKGTRRLVKHEDYYIYILASINHPVAAYAFVEGEYPAKRLIYQALQKSLDGFFQKMGGNWTLIKSDDKLEIQVIQAVVKDYSEPKSVDSLMKVQGKVDDIQGILLENINKLLENQGDLDALVEKSKDLSAASKQLYKQSKKLDKPCCVVF